MIVEIDVRDILPTIAAPTLVIHREHEIIPVEGARYIASQIPGARLAVLPGADHTPWTGDSEAYLDEIQEFLTGAFAEQAPGRVLSTVLFTDIVSSTEQASELGDRHWRELLEEHYSLVRAAGALPRTRGERHGGRSAGNVRRSGTGDSLRAGADQAPGALRRADPRRHPHRGVRGDRGRSRLASPCTSEPVSPRSAGPASFWSRARSRTWWRGLACAPQQRQHDHSSYYRRCHRRGILCDGDKICPENPIPAQLCGHLMEQHPGTRSGETAHLAACDQRFSIAKPILGCQTQGFNYVFNDCFDPLKVCCPGTMVSLGPTMSRLTCLLPVALWD